MKMKTTKAGRFQGNVWGLLVIVFVAALCGVTTVHAGDGKTIAVSVGEAVTIPAENVSKLAIADPAIADVAPLSDKELSIIGKKAGVTTLTIVLSDGSPAQIHRIEVGNDAAATTIREMIGQPSVAVRSIGDTLVLDGQVDDELQAARATQVASAYRDKVLNLLEIRKPRQIRIRIRVAEVNSSAAKNIGFKWFGKQGQIQYAMNFLGKSTDGTGETVNHGLGAIDQTAAGGVTGGIGTGVGADVILQLLVTKNMAKLLSEPTLVTYSGKEASFLVGKEIPIVQQLTTSFTVEFKEVGVRMKIKPTADSQGQINTMIHAEVSQVSVDTVKGAGGIELPIITSKKADTTLQVRDGQTIVIGGLLENNLSADTLRKVPWLADIPIFGFLFRHKQSNRDQSEVMFFMTPEVIKDIDADTAAAVKTPVLKEWNEKESGEKVLEIPKKNDDWGLHNPDGLGFSGLGSEKKENPPRVMSQEAVPVPTPIPAPVTEAPAAVPAVAEPAEIPAPPPPAVMEEAPAAPAAAPAPVQEAPAPPAPKPVEIPAPAPAPQAEQPAPAAPAKEPTVNFRPARPATQ
jgi:pilus assembly protein CpaC